VSAGLVEEEEAKITRILMRCVLAHTEAVARLLETDPHQFSTRGCQTCTGVTAILGRNFGCVAKARGR
jgi:hypothetical protein